LGGKENKTMLYLSEERKEKVMASLVSEKMSIGKIKRGCFDGKHKSN